MHKAKKTGNHAKDGEITLAYKARGGDSLAFQQIYEHHSRSLFAYIAKSLEGSLEEVEDIWQETWIAAVDSLQGYRGESRLFTWLCSIARHKIADHFRKKGRKEKLISQDCLEIISRRLDAEPLPEEFLTEKAVHLRVIETLMALPPDYREALTLRYADELSVAEVASKIRRNYKSTESLLTRARKAFQTEFTRLTADEKKDEWK
jgi:RNA polymerase sigma-70 factor (ECF subfamily)